MELPRSFIKQGLAGCFLCVAGSVSADEISGDWCSLTGAYLRIEGDRILTPGGRWTDGVYSRHVYTYVIPEGDDAAGAWVTLRQLSEERMISTQDGADALEWRRCGLTS